MLSKIKERLFNSLYGSEEDVDSSRRMFIKTASALAALTVIGVAAPSLLKIRSIEEKIASGTLEGETFYISKTIVIDIPNVYIENCTFIATEPMDVMIHFGPNAKDTYMKGCRLETNGQVDTCIILEPQGNNDMTKIFQSAFDTAGSVQLSKGDFFIDNAIGLKSQRLIGSGADVSRLNIEAPKSYLSAAILNKA